MKDPKRIVIRRQKLKTLKIKRLNQALKMMAKGSKLYEKANKLPRRNYKLKKELTLQAHKIYETANKLLNAPYPK